MGAVRCEHKAVAGVVKEAAKVLRLQVAERAVKPSSPLCDPSLSAVYMSDRHSQTGECLAGAPCVLAEYKPPT